MISASSRDSLRIVVITGRRRACSDGSEVRRQPTTQFLRYSRLIAAFRPKDANKGKMLEGCYEFCCSYVKRRHHAKKRATTYTHPVGENIEQRAMAKLNLQSTTLCVHTILILKKKQNKEVFARTRVKVLKTFLVQQGCLQLTFQLSLFGSLCFRSCSRGLQLAGRATEVGSKHETKYDQLLRRCAGTYT